MARRRRVGRFRSNFVTSLSKIESMRKSILFFFLLCISFGFSQEDAWVYFTDKPDTAYYLSNPLEMLSQRALDRRAAQAIALDNLDVPIHQPYVVQVASNNGVIVLAQSKWLNAVHVRGTQQAIQSLATLACVSQIQFANPALQNNASGKPLQTVSVVKNLETQVDFNYGISAHQITMLKGHLLHQNHFTGTGKIIAVMDNGFSGVNTAAPFQRLMTQNSILGGYNFVLRNDAIYSGGSHGTLVLSTMGGYQENQLIGSAPDAHYYLFVTESDTYENPLEESLWVEAAELADSLGVDIINTSLGYSTFDNPAYNYSYNDMNGLTTFIARGAAIAFSRGMICVTSAGNSGNSTWQYITSPGDARHTLTVGAVTAQGNYATFSSQGPSFDQRIKPDVVAQGVGAVVATPSGVIGTASGTSFSSPITAGLVACLWQGLPNATNAQIMELIQQSASLYAMPTPQLGYGIPDFYAAYQTGLTLSLVPPVYSQALRVFPNPCGATIRLSSTNSKEGQLTIYSAIGQLVKQQYVTSDTLISVADLRPGLYLYSFQSANEIVTGKLIKKHNE